MSIRSTLGRCLRECVVHLERCARPRGHRRLVVLPSGGRWAGSNMLWGWELAAALRRIGWRVTLVPQQLTLQQRRRVIRWEAPDAILMIKGRHPLNRPSFYAPTPVAFVLDDADYVDPRQAEQVIECCRDSHAVIAGNRPVAEWCQQHNPNTTVIWVSHPVPVQRLAPESRRRGPVVAWAHANPLAYPHECTLVQDVLLRLQRRRPFDFWLYGVQDGQPLRQWLAPLAEAGIRIRTMQYFPRYHDYLASLSAVAVGLHPVCLENPYCLGKSFGKILSYLAADVAVVTSHALDHVEFFRDGDNGMLPHNEDPDRWADDIALLLQDPERRQRLVDRAFADFRHRLSSDAAAHAVDRVLHTVRTGTPDALPAQLA